MMATIVVVVVVVVVAAATAAAMMVIMVAKVAVRLTITASAWGFSIAGAVVAPGRGLSRALRKRHDCGSHGVLSRQYSSQSFIIQCAHQRDHGTDPWTWWKQTTEARNEAGVDVDEDHKQIGWSQITGQLGLFGTSVLVVHCPLLGSLAVVIGFMIMT